MLNWLQIGLLIKILYLYSYIYGSTYLYYLFQNWNKKFKLNFFFLHLMNLKSKQLMRCPHFEKKNYIANCIIIIIQKKVFWHHYVFIIITVAHLMQLQSTMVLTIWLKKLALIVVKWEIWSFSQPKINFTSHLQL